MKSKRLSKFGSIFKISYNNKTRTNIPNITQNKTETQQVHLVSSTKGAKTSDNRHLTFPTHTTQLLQFKWFAVQTYAESDSKAFGPRSLRARLNNEILSHMCRKGTLLWTLIDIL